MERAPQFEYTNHERGNEGGSQWQELRDQAVDTAVTMINERIDSSLQDEERFAAIRELMEELAQDNGNRFIIEAIAQRLTLERKALELQELEDRYQLAA